MAFYFRLPIYGDLTSEQRALLLESSPLSIGGGPGTGKSVVSLWRHIMNYQQARSKSLLLTYTKSLEYYLKASARQESELAAKNIGRIYWWTTHDVKELEGQIEEIIVDEAQDVEFEKHEILKDNSLTVTYTADDHQILYPDRGTTLDGLKSFFNQNVSYRLNKNFRNTKEISRFIKAVLPNRLISEGEDEGMLPNLICSNNNHEVQRKIAMDVIRKFRSSTHNIAILHPSTGLVNMWYKILKDNKIDCSKYINSDEYLGEIDNVHICTYKSAKGLEFDTVIMPDMNCYEYNLDKLDIIEENDYYVAFTRAKRNLFLIENSALKNGKVFNPFLENAISNNLVEVDYSYLTDVNTTTSSMLSDNTFEDDLPF